MELGQLAPVPASARGTEHFYQHIAGQLRHAILSGAVAPAERLPNEVDLAEIFHTSRATVREALRVLDAEGLITTRKGVKGGSFVAQPSAADTAERLRADLNRLSPSLSLDDFMEIRSFIEVPGARLAAIRRTPEELRVLMSTIPTTRARLDDQEFYGANRDFHSELIRMCHNPLMRLTADPMFHVLQTGLDRTRLPHRFHATVAQHHRDIAAAVTDGEGDRAADLMSAHLDWLKVRYRRVWRNHTDDVGGTR